MTGRPCGRKAAFATTGYFGRQRNRRGRQTGYVVASQYEEIVVERLFDGKTQLTTALRPLVEAAEQTLDLDEAKRQRTILRVDSGGRYFGRNLGSYTNCPLKGRDRVPVSSLTRPTLNRRPDSQRAVNHLLALRPAAPGVAADRPPDGTRCCARWSAAGVRNLGRPAAQLAPVYPGSAGCPGRAGVSKECNEPQDTRHSGHRHRH